MAILKVSVRKLRAGDQFRIRSIAGGGFPAYFVDIVTGTPDTLEAEDTSSVIPSSEEWIKAVENLAKAFEDMELMGSVSFDTNTDQTVITCTSNEDLDISFLKNIANGSEIEFISLVNGNGTKYDITTDPAEFGNILVPNITVTSIDHSLNEFPTQPTEQYLRGNPHAEIKTEVYFTTRDSATGKQLEYSFGIVPNTTNPYATGSTSLSEPYKIDESLFENRLSGSVQSYRGEIGSFANPITPINFQTGTVEITDLGGNNYKLTHIYRAIDFSSEDVSDDATSIFTPSILDGKKSAKYILEINIYPDEITSLSDETTKKQDLTQYMPDGALGWLNQVYNSPVKEFSLNSFAWDTPSGLLNAAFVSEATAQVKLLSGSWAGTEPVVICIQQINDSYDPDQTLSENILFDNVVLVTDGVPVSSTNLLNVACTVDGGDPSLLNVDLDVNEDIYRERFVITFQSLVTNTSTISLNSGTAVSLADETVITMGTYPGSSLNENYSFNLHYNKDIADAFNQVKAFTEDHYISRFRIENSDLVNTTLVRFAIRIMNRTTGIELETKVVQASDLDFTEQRAFRLDDQNDPEYVFIIITDNQDGTYDFQYPFQIWRDWFQQSNLVFRCQGTFDQVLNTGEIATFTKTFDSPDFEMGDYDQTKNTALEPQALRKPPSIEFEDEATGNPLSVIKNSGKTRVIATWEDNNLNDLQVEPAAPHVYETPVLNGLTAYFGLNTDVPAQNKYIRFHNFRPNPSTIDGENNPWEIIPLYPTYNAKLTRIDIKTAKLEAVLDAEKIKAIYGDNFKCLDITARLDKYQVPEICWVFETNFDVQDVGGDGTFDPTIDQNADWILIDGTTYNPIINVPDRTITGPPFITANELNGTDQIVKVCDFNFALVTTIVFVDDHIRNNFNLTDFSGLTSITITNNSTEFQIVAPSHNLATSQVNTSLNSNLTSLDLSQLTNLSGDVTGTNCPLMTDLILPNSAGSITTLSYQNCDSLISVDISILTNISGTIGFDLCNNLTSLICGSTNNVIDDFTVASSNLNSLDVSGYTGLSGFFSCAVNTNMTSLITPVSSGVFTKFFFQICNITGVLDLSGLTGLGGDVRGDSNSNLTNVLWPVTSEVIFNLEIKSTAVVTHDFTNLSNLSGSVDFSQNNSCTSVILPASNQVFTLIIGTNTKITAFDITPLTGANNNIDIRLASCDMATAALDTILNDLDAKGWTGGILNITNQDTLQSPTPALPAIANLLGKGWTLNY
jgi:hypothetical protein